MWGAAAPTPLKEVSEGHMCRGEEPYPEDGPGVEIPLIPVKEQKIVREEEDVDAQPGCLRGKAMASRETPTQDPPLPHSPQGWVQPGGRQGSASPPASL